tara:strand:- start:8136 stop:8582 length:447 start_codon:yes stop_codon:yes gene_type:complete
MEIIQRYLNDDVLNIVKDYVCQLEHRDKFSETLNIIIKEAYIYTYKYIYRSFYLEHIIGRDECIRMFSVFEQCKCCEKHQINKPNMKDLLNGYLPPYSTSYSYNKICDCPCRHICRTICRELNDVEWIDMLSDEEFSDEDWPDDLSIS